MIKEVRYELRFKSWEISYQPEGSLPYWAHAHWYSDTWKYEVKDALTHEHRHERFATYKEALAWCRKQEKL